MGTSTSDDLQGTRVLIVSGDWTGHEGICLGKAADGRRYAISPTEATVILALEIDTEFGLLVNLSGNPQSN